MPSRRPVAALACLLGLCAAPTLPAAVDVTGYAVLEIPESSRAFISGQVTALARNQDGLLFVGSSRLAVFDGLNWQRILVPNNVGIVALDPVGQDRVWVGGEGIIGWIARTDTGEWIFHSLEPELRAAGFDDPVNFIFYTVSASGGGATFVARTKVLRWDGRKFTIWDLPASHSRIYGFTAGDDLLIYQPGTGLVRMEPDGPRLWLPLATLPSDQPVAGYVPRPDGSALVVFNEEVYRREGERWTRLDPVSNELRGRRALQVVPAGPDTLAIATGYGGVVLTNAAGDLRGLVTTQSGLPDDHVNTLATDPDRQIWIGTISGGVVRLAGPGAVTVIDRRMRLTPRPLRLVAEWAGRLRVVSQRRVFTLPKSTPQQPGQFEVLEPFWANLECAAVFDGRLWFGGNGGLWSMTANGTMEQTMEVRETTVLLPVSGTLPSLLVGSSEGTVLLHEGSRERTALPLALETGDVVVSAVEDTTGRLWLATRRGVVVRLERDPTAPAGWRSLGRVGSLPPEPSTLTLVNDLICAWSGERTLAWDEAAQQFVPLAGFEAWRVLAAVPIGTEGAYWSVRPRDAEPDSPNALLHVRRSAGQSPGLAWAPLAVPGLDQAGDINHLSLTAGEVGPVLWIGGDSALLRVETHAIRPAANASPVTLQSLVVDSVRRTLPGASAARFPADTGRLQFTFAVARALADDPAVRFQTRLLGAEAAWSRPQASPLREFSGLPAGSHSLLARGIDRFGRAGPALEVKFAIATPWYWQSWAIALWIAAVGALAWSAHKWRLRALHQESARLEQLVNDRTRELSLSNTAKSEFLDNLGHEIRRPANGLASVVRKLEAGGLSPDQRAQTRLLHLATGSLLKLCDEVLNFSEVDAGGAPVEERPFLLRELLPRVLAESGASEAVTVHWPPDFTDGFVGDDTKLGITVANLAANALRHAPGAPIEINVSAVPLVTGGMTLLIEVADGGPGVPADEQEVIFKRFIRGSRAQADRVPGTGIGLAMCRAMARLLGGSVGVESPSEIARERGWPGPGATFFVRVPLAQPGPGNAATPSQPPRRVKPFSMA